MSSLGAASAALAGRGNRMNASEDSDYQVILPQLPTGRVVNNTVFLHGDVRVRPFRVEDFRDAIDQAGMLPEVVALGAYQINHVWAVTLNSAEATKRMVDLKELQVKRRRCLIIDPQDHQIRLRLHWLLHGVDDEDVRTALATFGKVTEITRERWRVQGVSDKGSTTRSVLLKLKPGMKVDDLPHQIRVGGELALVVAPGHPMQCLRCRGVGHVRRDCKVPRCSRCRRFGHTDAQCVRTYATATGPGAGVESSEQIMDIVEAEEAAEGTSEPETLAASSSERQSTLDWATGEQHNEPSVGSVVVEKEVEKVEEATKIRKLPRCWSLRSHRTHQQRASPGWAALVPQRSAAMTRPTTRQPAATKSHQQRRSRVGGAALDHGPMCWTGILVTSPLRLKARPFNVTAPEASSVALDVKGKRHAPGPASSYNQTWLPKRPCVYLL